MSLMFTNEELLELFPGSRENRRKTSILLEGYKAVFRRLIHVFEDAYRNEDDEKLDVHPGDRYLYRIAERNEETGKIERKSPKDTDLAIPSLVLPIPRSTPPTLGEENDHHYIRFGEINGNERWIRFPLWSISNLVFDLYVLRDNILDSVDDTEIWEYLWREHHFLAIGREVDSETGEVIKEGVSFRTRMVERMTSDNIVNYSDLSVMRGTVEIQRLSELLSAQ